MPDTHANLEPRTLPPELRALLETRDADACEASLDSIFARRQRDLFRSLGHRTRDLHGSIKVEDARLALGRLTGSLRGTPSEGESHAQRVSAQDEGDRVLSEFGF